MVTAGGGQGQIEKNLRKAITYAASNQRVRIAFAYASFNAFVFVERDTGVKSAGSVRFISAAGICKNSSE